MEVRTGYSLWVLQYKPSATVMIVAIALEPLIYQVFFVCSRASSTRASRRRVAILYSSSQNSLVRKAEVDSETLFRWSQSFIHQVRILSSKRRMRSACTCRVAILYSSSQNSLCTSVRIKMCPQWTSRNPLFIKSEFSL